ncbi:arginyl-tRNA--protein transferase 1-like isoform X2 [Ostrinia nubilalis]|uniref:arginyl-tRNA--protein transferase 1-like isoform X2 n=1 Tax=Ostrinia nubilalis TaxID=29057 RepID=UPI0030822D10
MLRSVVEYYSEHSGYSCGYCKSPDSNFSHGMWAHAMSVTDYQDLIDRGWRRSGKYCYKPTMEVTCCPMYTIRCRALEFKPTKSQKKILKRFNKYLTGQDLGQAADRDRKMSTCSSGTDEEQIPDGREHYVESTKACQDIDVDAVLSSDMIEEPAIMNEDNVSTVASSGESSQAKKPNLPKPTEKIKETGKDLGPDPNKPPCKKAKQLRLQRKLEKMKEKGIDVSNLPKTCRDQEKQVEDFINELPSEVKHKLEIRLVRTSPASTEWLATSKETHEVYVKYQTVIHGDKPEKVTEPKFKEFLVQSPLLEEHSDSGPACGYGSFHQQYWLDGKLIAVGVIDILPRCVSSVYFFYDPQYMNLTLGTYGALREIQFTRELHKTCPELKYYYMGYYIHSCRKMRYKGNFSPSDLLCPETYKWFPIKDCIPKLEASKYSRLDPDLDSTDDNYPAESDLNYVPVWTSGAVMFYKIYRRRSLKRSDDRDEVMEYARLVGTKSAKSIILFR